jgi:membrane protein required for colicin V production
MEALGLNFVDWTIIVVITASVVLSIIRGFVKEFLSLFIWVIAFFAAVNFEFLATPKINEFLGNPDISKIISYVVVFIIALFLGGLVIKFLSGLVKWSGASGFDKLLGVLFGFTRGLLILFIIFLLLPASAQSNESMTNSKLVPIIQKYAPQIEVFFRELINNRDELIEEAMDKIDPLLDDVIPEQDTEEDELGES